MRLSTKITILWINKKRSPKLRTVEWEQRESNPRPSACKADALNQLSYAPETGLQIYGDFSILQILFEKVAQFSVTNLLGVHIFGGNVLYLHSVSMGMFWF